MLREVAQGSPGSLLRWLARCHSSCWARARPLSCVNTAVSQRFPLQTKPHSNISYKAEMLQV